MNLRDLLASHQAIPDGVLRYYGDKRLLTAHLVQHYSRGYARVGVSLFCVFSSYCLPLI